MAVVVKMKLALNFYERTLKENFILVLRTTEESNFYRNQHRPSNSSMSSFMFTFFLMLTVTVAQKKKFPVVKKVLNREVTEPHTTVPTLTLT